jgi:uncharacterized membrane protein
LASTTPTSSTATESAPFTDGARLWLALVGLTLAGLLIRGFWIDHHSYWFDEYATYSICSQPWSTLVGPLMRLETNPPGYYVLQKAWMVVGDSRTAMRLLSAVAGSLITPVLFLLARRLAGRTEAWIAATLFLTAPLHVEYARELRGYALLTLAALVAILATVVLLDHGPAGGRPDTRADERRRRPTIVAATILALSVTTCLYLHNTAVFIPVILGGFVVLDGLARGPARPAGFWRWRTIILGIIAAGSLPFALWLPTMYAQATSEAGAPIHWIPDLSPFHVYSTLIRTYPYPTWFKPVIYSVAAAGCVLAFRRSWRLGLLTAICLVGQPLMALAASFVVPIFVRKILLWPSALVFIPIALVIVHLRPAGRIAAVLLIVAMQLLALRPEYPRTRIPDAYGEAAVFITASVESAAASTDAVLVCSPPDIAMRLQYAFREFPIPADRWLTVAPRGEAVKAIDPLLPGTGIVWDDLGHELAAHSLAWIMIDSSTILNSWERKSMEASFDMLNADGWLTKHQKTTKEAEIWIAIRRPL